MNSSELIELQKKFVNLRFGMFIHFNSSTFQFANYDLDDWDYGYENSGDPARHIFDPKMWNPSELDCSEWAKAARSAGMTFSLLTVKHHEGFDLWPSTYTNHCVKNATLKTDVLKEYLTAFRKEGVIPGLYFSMLDLQHNINRKKCTPEDKHFIKNQLCELFTNYGEIPFIIFDGWNALWGGPLYDNLPFGEICDYIRQMQPNCLVLNISCEVNLNHTDIVSFENAAGQGIPEDFYGPGSACNVLTKHWFWKETDPDLKLKSADWVIKNIQDMNKHNVTFILNVSPNQKGRIDDNFKKRLSEIGKLYKKIPDLNDIPKNWMTR